MIDSRQQFEAWAVSKGMSVRRSLTDPDSYFFQTPHNCWVGWRERGVNSTPDFHEWLETATPLADFESQIKNGNFDHADVVKLMELAYNTGANRL